MALCTRRVAAVLLLRQLPRALGPEGLVVRASLATGNVPSVQACSIPEGRASFYTIPAASLEQMVRRLSSAASSSASFSELQHLGCHGIHRGHLPFAVRAMSTTFGKGPGPQEQETVPSSNDPTGVDAQMDAKKEQLKSMGAEVVESEYWGIQPKLHKRPDGTDWPWHSFRPTDCYAADINVDIKKHFRPANFGDAFAYHLVKLMRLPTDLFFRKKYGCRAMMLETVAAVPGMVGGMLLHLKSLRRFEHTGGWIRALLDEAENERMHLMTFMEVAQPNWFERALVLAVQGVFFNIYFLAYLVNPRIAHRVVGYLEEEAVHSYTEYLKELDAGRLENVPAPPIAIDYWQLPKDATIRDVCIVVRADEAHHRDVNHFAANVVQEGKHLKDHPAPVGYH